MSVVNAMLHGNFNFKVLVIAQFLNLDRPAQLLHLQPLPDGLHSHLLKCHDGQMLLVDIMAS